MAKHKAETRARLGLSPLTRQAPRHRRRDGRPRVVSALVLTTVIGGGVVTTMAGSEVASIDLGAAQPDAASAAAVIASRQEPVSSRAGSRLLLGAERVDELETQAQRLTAQLQRQEQRRIERREARQQAAEERREQRRQERLEQLEARRWGSPLDSISITSPYGEVSYIRSGVHTGTDFDGVTGAPVRSVGPGTVTSAGFDGSYGYKVVVQHDDGSETWYCHLSSISTSTGATVTNDTTVGLLGATGNVTGDHLHLEWRLPNGEPSDPLSALAARGVDLY